MYYSIKVTLKNLFRAKSSKLGNDDTDHLIDEWPLKNNKYCKQDVTCVSDSAKLIKKQKIWHLTCSTVYRFINVDSDLNEWHILLSESTWLKN